MKEHTKKTISLEEAKAQFEELLEDLLAGKSIRISTEGEDPVILSLNDSARAKRKRGTAGKFRGQITMPTDEEWADMDKEIEDDMLNGELFPE